MPAQALVAAVLGLAVLLCLRVADWAMAGCTMFSDMSLHVAGMYMYSSGRMELGKFRRCNHDCKDSGCGC